MVADVSVVPAHVDVVQAFYAAVADAEPGVLGDIITRHFATDVTIDWPPSLPYGGQVEGAGRLRTMFVGMAASDTKVGPDALEVLSITAGPDRVAVELAFDWFPPGKSEAVRSGALELWTFTGDEVSSIRAYYWDTAALAAASS